MTRRAFVDESAAARTRHYPLAAVPGVEGHGFEWSPTMLDDMRYEHVNSADRPAALTRAWSADARS